VTVIAAGYDYMSGKRKRHGPSLRLWQREDVGLAGVHCVRTFGLPGYKKSVFRRIIAYSSFSFLGFVSALTTRNIDIVFAPNNPPTNSFFGYLLSKLKGAKFVEELREPHPEIDVALGYFKARPVQGLYRRYHDFFHRRSDLIVSLTPGITRVLRSRGVPDLKIVEVPNAYDVENDEVLNECTREMAKARMGWDSKFVVLYAGSHGLAPDLQTLVEAAKRLTCIDDIVFVLVGEGDKKRQYLEYARANRLPNCIFVPGQPRERMPVYYKAADVCTHLIPSGEFWDCVLPNKIFDYLGSGTAVVFSGQGDTARLLQQAEAGVVVEPENPRAFAEAVLELYKNPDRTRMLGENGRKHVLSHYCREKLMARLEQSFEELLCKKDR
jgi:glycosyltransferase involved in cell wall biosynthesis